MTAPPPQDTALVLLVQLHQYREVESDWALKQDFGGFLAQ